MVLTLIDTAFMDEIWTFSMKMINFGLTIFVGCFIFVTSLNYSAERQVGLLQNISLEAVIIFVWLTFRFTE